MENGSSDLITIGELAHELGMSKAWIYARTSRGQGAIPHIKFGKLLRFRKERVLAFFENEEYKKEIFEKNKTTQKV